MLREKLSMKWISTFPLWTRSYGRGKWRKLSVGRIWSNNSSNGKVFIYFQGINSRMYQPIYSLYENYFRSCKLLHRFCYCNECRGFLFIVYKGMLFPIVNKSFHVSILFCDFSATFNSPLFTCTTIDVKRISDEAKHNIDRLIWDHLVSMTRWGQKLMQQWRFFVSNEVS